MNTRIIIGENSGFCTGVTRAIKIAENQAMKNGAVFTNGPLIHNPQVVEELKNKNIVSIKNTVGLKKGETVLIRSHGIPLSEEKSIKGRGINLIDATCPKVKKAQKICKNLSEKYERVYLVGIKEHPEVKGIVSRAPDKVTVISSVKAARKEQNVREAGVLVQTTFRREKFFRIVSELVKKAKILKIINTICTETINRQESVRKIREKSELLFVVGGKNSSNTKRLYEMGKKKTETYHIETPDEIQKEMLTGKKIIGIVSGASTPYTLVENTEKKVKGFCMGKVKKTKQ